MNIQRYINTTEYRQICVLKFLREFTKIPAKDIAENLKISTASLSLIENGKREADKEDISRLSNALQDRLNVSKDIEKLTEVCSDNPVLMNLLQDYDSEKRSFSTVYNIAKQIAAVSETIDKQLYLSSK